MSFLVLLYAIILSILPIFELRGGMIYAILAGINPFQAFIICTLANILIIFFVFFFLDYLHGSFMKLKSYKTIFNLYIEKTRKKVDKFKKNYSIYGFLALAIFVAIPLPATGAWTGCLIAWLLELERKKSILAIALGVLTAGLLVLLASLGIINIIKIA